MKCAQEKITINIFKKQFICDSKYSKILKTFKFTQKKFVLHFHWLLIHDRGEKSGQTHVQTTHVNIF